MIIKKKTAPLCVPSNGILSASLQARLAKSADDYAATLLQGGDRSRKRVSKILEQYYTDVIVAQEMLNFLEQYCSLEDYFCVEPSAGDGAFSGVLPSDSLAFDVEPHAPGIIKANYLALTIDHDGPIAVVGNPPFRAAVPFFNHAAEQADMIAMILPRSFTKPTKIDLLDRRFELVAQMDVPAHAFLRAGRPYNVPAVFQIWQKRDFLRPLSVKRTTQPDFTFGKPAGAHFAIQRVGANAGRVHHHFHRSGQAHLFITVNDKKRAAEIEAVMKKLPLASVAKATGGYPSITKSEIVAMYA